MPAIANRDAYEARLARIVARLTADQRKRLIAAMGTPPDVSRVPDELWDELESEQSRALRWLITGTYIASAATLAGIIVRKTGHQTPPDFVVGEAQKWAATAADELSAGMIDHTRQRLTVAADDYTRALATVPPPPLRPLDPNEPIDAEFRSLGITGPQAKVEVDPRKAKEEFDERIESIFGERRAGRIGKTETTRAQTAGASPVKNRFESDTGGKVLHIWRHRAAKIKGEHPCPLCAPLVGTSETEWASINPDAAMGPPLHVNCDCVLEEIIITPAEWRRQSRAAPRGSDLEVAEYDRAWQRIMNSLSPRDVR